MNMTTARQQVADITSKYGLKKVLSCGCLGCLVPILSMLVFLLAVGWWLFAGTTATPTAHSAPRYPVASNVRYASTAGFVAAPVTQQGQAVRAGVPTPIYAPDNAQGAIRQGLPSMMGNQPLNADYRSEGLAAYTPNRLGLPAGLYLGYANAIGARRTPYVKGQQLSNGLTVVTGDFDFVLLQDASGAQWYCDPTGTNCQWWR